MELSEELKTRREEWRKLGFLLPVEDAATGKEYNLKAFGRHWLIGFHKSSSSYWDTFLAEGNIYTTSLSLQKVRFMSDEGVVLDAKKIVFFRWLLIWSSWKDE